MQIAFAASECTPFAKTGGLADVVGALPRELEKLGHEVTVYLPFYARVRRFIRSENGGEPQYAIRSLTIPFRHYNRFVGVVDGGKRDGVQYYFIDCPELFDRKELYGPSGGDYTDNAERFGLFCRAVIEASKHLGVPQVFHVHDWQAALIPVYLRTMYAADPALHGAATVLTIHNAAYQGKFPPNTTEQLLFPWDIFTMDKVEQFDRFNFLKGGVVFSDLLTTVSRNMPRRFRRRSSASNWRAFCCKRAADLHGILNGVDYAQWNPATRRTPGRALHAGESRRQARLPRRSAACLRTGECRGDDAGHRHRVAAGHAKGIRHCGQDCGGDWRSAMWRWWRWAAAIPTTRISSAAGLSGIRRAWPCRFATTKRWRTRSRPARTCS